MSRYKTFDATGLATAGRIYAGDLNAIQDMKADQANFAQTIDLATLRIGDSALGLSKFGAGVVSLSAALRLSGLLRVPQGIDPGGGLSTTARDALGAGLAPPGFVFYNSTIKRWQFNVGTDIARDFLDLGGEDVIDRQEFTSTVTFPPNGVAPGVLVMQSAVLDFAANTNIKIEMFFPSVGSNANTGGQTTLAIYFDTTLQQLVTTPFGGDFLRYDQYLTLPAGVDRVVIRGWNNSPSGGGNAAAGDGVSGHTPKGWMTIARV